jgi:hypothetical protein
MVGVVHGMETQPLPLIQGAHNGVVAIGALGLFEGFQGFAELGDRFHFISLDPFRGPALDARGNITPQRENQVKHLPQEMFSPKRHFPLDFPLASASIPLTKISKCT